MKDIIKNMDPGVLIFLGIVLLAMCSFMSSAAVEIAKAMNGGG